MRTVGTVPGRFESHLAKDPYAPALEVYRSNGRLRKWTRAAIEHHAIRIGSLCAAYGLGADGRVALQVSDPLCAMAGAYYALGTGRILTLPDAADLVIDDSLVPELYGLDPDYVMRVVVAAEDPATWVDEPQNHARLAQLLEAHVPSGLGPDVDEVLATLWHGTPLRIYEDRPEELQPGTRSPRSVSRWTPPRAGSPPRPIH